MKKIILDFDSNNGLFALLINNGTKKVFYNRDLNNILAQLNSQKITDYAISDRDLILRYDSYDVCIRECESLFSLRQFNTNLKLKKYKEYIMTSIAKINTKKSLNAKPQKVKRKSKVGTTVVTVGLASLMLITSTLMLHNNKISPQEEVGADNPENVEVIIPDNETTYNYVAMDNLVVNNQTEEVKNKIETLSVKEETSKEDDVKLQSDSASTKTNVNNINMSFEDRTSSTKAESCKKNYQDVISETAKMYGIDPQIMLAIATQERGTHSSEIDKGGGLGLMQIQYSVWINQDISAYNYETNEKEILHITDSNIRDLETNIKIACMIYQGCLNNMHYNIPAALQAYNWGYGGAMSKISKYAMDCGKTSASVLDDYQDTSWLKYFGDNCYSDLVLSYLDTSKDIENLKIEENKPVAINYHINNSYSKNLAY